MGGPCTAEAEEREVENPCAGTRVEGFVQYVDILVRHSNTPITLLKETAFRPLLFQRQGEF